MTNEEILKIIEALKDQDFIKYKLMFANQGEELSQLAGHIEIFGSEIKKQNEIINKFNIGLLEKIDELKLNINNTNNNIIVMNRDMAATAAATKTLEIRIETIDKKIIQFYFAAIGATTTILTLIGAIKLIPTVQEVMR